MTTQHLLEWSDGVKQAAIVLEAGLGKDDGVLCADEPFISEGADVFAHRVDAHPRCRADGFVAGPELVSTSVCTAEEVGVHCELTRR